ncbi:MAG: glycosyltransferase [Labilithrix sp.]|nr:glycosyltransferase [Labilithrix sp.]
MRALYVSHNGMLENLGQAQVLPYLRGLARRGVDFDLLSFELPTAERPSIDALAESLRADGIRWTPLRRARDPQLRTKVLESSRGVLRAFVTALRRRPDVVHGRSYLPTAIADLVSSVVPKARLVFDCRGMLGDEYVDAGYWTPDRLEYRLIKRYERRAFQRAEGIVVLTETLRGIARERGWVGPRSTIEAIPCCVDTGRFHFDERGRREVRDELGVADRLVIVYSGSLGGWYLEEELARFAGLVKRATERRIAMLVLTHQDSDALRSGLGREGLTPDEIVVRRVAPADMPRFLSAGDLALSFIKSCFSKLGSSPTKVAEYLACGLPVVLNGDVGDQADLAREQDACVVVSSFSPADLAEAARRALPLAERPIGARVTAGREVAERRFGLESIGVARYERLYRAVVAGP